MYLHQQGKMHEYSGKCQPPPPQEVRDSKMLIIYTQLTNLATLVKFYCSKKCLSLSFYDCERLFHSELLKCFKI
jgi:hypothetical protein